MLFVDPAATPATISFQAGNKGVVVMVKKSLQPCTSTLLLVSPDRYGDAEKGIFLYFYNSQLDMTRTREEKK